MALCVATQEVKCNKAPTGRGRVKRSRDVNGDVTVVLCCLAKHRHVCAVNFRTGGDLLSKFRKLKDYITFEISGHYRLEHKDSVDI